MAPNNEINILNGLNQANENILKIAETVGEIKGEFNAKEKACQVCNQDNRLVHDQIFTKLNESSRWRAAHEAAEKAEEKVAVQQDQANLSTWQKIAAWATIFGVLIGSLTGLAGLAKWALSSLGVKT
jgi:hypothetical protein